MLIQVLFKSPKRFSFKTKSPNILTSLGKPFENHRNAILAYIFWYLWHWQPPSPFARYTQTTMRSMDGSLFLPKHHKLSVLTTEEKQQKKKNHHKHQILSTEFGTCWIWWMGPTPWVWCSGTHTLNPTCYVLRIQLLNAMLKRAIRCCIAASAGWRHNADVTWAAACVASLSHPGLLVAITLTTQDASSVILTFAARRRKPPPEVLAWRRTPEGAWPGGRRYACAERLSAPLHSNVDGPEKRHEGHEGGAVLQREWEPREGVCVCVWGVRVRGSTCVCGHVCVEIRCTCVCGGMCVCVWVWRCVCGVCVCWCGGVCVWRCVCVEVCVWRCVCMCGGSCVWRCVCVCQCGGACVWRCVCMCGGVCVEVCVRVCVEVCSHVSVWRCMYVEVCVWVWRCVCVRYACASPAEECTWRWCTEAASTRASSSAAPASTPPVS